MSEKRTFEHKNVTNNNIGNRKGEKKMHDMIFVHKQAGAKKDAVRVISIAEKENSMNNIPNNTSQKSNLTCEERTSKTYYKGEKTMRKIIMTVLTTMLIGMMLTGCSNPFRKDDKHATVSMTTSDGQAYVFQSFNGSNATVSGKELALRTGKINFNLKTGETAHIVFKCDACGNEQEFDIDNAWSDVISCDCPEKIDKDGNAREYSAIEVTYDQEETTK